MSPLDNSLHQHLSPFDFLVKIHLELCLLIDYPVLADILVGTARDLLDR